MGRGSQEPQAYEMPDGRSRRPVRLPRPPSTWIQSGKAAALVERAAPCFAGPRTCDDRVVNEELDRTGRSALHYASVSGDDEAVAALIAMGFDVDRQDDAGFTSLHLAAQSMTASVARALLEAGASVDARNIFGNTPLWIALMNVHDTEGEVVRVLLDAGADLDAANESGVSPRNLIGIVANYDLGRFIP